MISKSFSPFILGIRGIRGHDHNCPVRWLLSADKSIIEYGF
jgi:hypothetical protein